MSFVYRLWSLYALSSQTPRFAAFARSGVEFVGDLFRRATLNREFRLGETLATILVRLAARVAAKEATYTYGFFTNLLLGSP